MSNAILSWPDRTIAGSLSGGSWTTASPLTNLQSKLLGAKARTVNALTSSSIILVDIGSTARAIRVISLIAHNISFAGTVRARGFSDNGYTTLVSGADTGTQYAWPQSGFTAEDATEYPATWTYVFSSSKTARYWKIEITDSTNAAGYIELGRLWIGESRLEPSTGISYGAALGYESRDVIEESLGGVRWAEKRTPRRVASVSFEALNTAEKQKALIMQKTLTMADELLFVMNGLDDAQNMLLQAFPSTIQQVSPLKYPYYDAHELPLELLEVV